MPTVKSWTKFCKAGKSSKKKQIRLKLKSLSRLKILRRKLKRSSMQKKSKMLARSRHLNKRWTATRPFSRTTSTPSKRSLMWLTREKNCRKIKALKVQIIKLVILDGSFWLNCEHHRRPIYQASRLTNRFELKRDWKSLASYLAAGWADWGEERRNARRRIKAWPGACPLDQGAQKDEVERGELRRQACQADGRFEKAWAKKMRVRGSQLRRGCQADGGTRERARPSSWTVMRDRAAKVGAWA
jgi:hypothetical protein